MYFDTVVLLKLKICVLLPSLPDRVASLHSDDGQACFGGITWLVLMME